MSGLSIHLLAPSEDETAATIREYFSYAERKHENHCPDDEELWLDEYRRSALERYEEEGRFFVSMPIDRKLVEFVEWDDVTALSGDWIVAGDDIEVLISLFRTARDVLTSTADDLAWDYKCYVESSPIAVCEFALENGYAVRIVD